MVSDRQKGQGRVREFINDILKPLNFLYWTPGNKAVWIRDKAGSMRPISQSQDIFEVADIIATRHDTRVLLIQVTGEGSLMTERRQKFLEKSNYFNRDHVMCVVAGRCFGKKEWIISAYRGETKWDTERVKAKDYEKILSLIL